MKPGLAGAEHEEALNAAASVCRTNKRSSGKGEATHSINHNSTEYSRRDALAIFWIVNGAHHRFVSVQSGQSVS